MKTTNLTPALAIFLAACSSVQSMDGRELKSIAGTCSVTVFQTYAQAEKNGKIEELCIISGTSAPTFPGNHTVPTAIAKHKDKACACGASNVYIQSQSDNYFDGPALVTMIAFRYVTQQ